MRSDGARRLGDMSGVGAGQRGGAGSARRDGWRWRFRLGLLDTCSFRVILGDVAVFPGLRHVVMDGALQRAWRGRTVGRGRGRLNPDLLVDLPGTLHHKARPCG